MLDDLWSAVDSFCIKATELRMNTSMMEPSDDEDDAFVPLRASLHAAYTAVLANPAFEFLRAFTAQLAPRGLDTAGNVDSAVQILRHLARAIARLRGFTESLGLFGRFSIYRQGLHSIAWTTSSAPAPTTRRGTSRCCGDLPDASAWRFAGFRGSARRVTDRQDLRDCQTAALPCRVQGPL